MKTGDRTVRANAASLRIYAAYGMAACDAQVLESSLVGFCSALTLAGKRLKPSEYRALFESYQEKTLGQLLKAAQKLVPAELEIALEWIPKALKHRNFLAHNFFLEYAVQWDTASGQKHMLSRLSEMSLVFQTASDAVSVMTGALLKKLGMTEAMLAHAKEQLERQNRDVH